MKIRAQIGMVLNLDKCIGCHTCSVSCKNVWTQRQGVEYAWFNHVESKPGVGYPHHWEDQDKWLGGWVRRQGKLVPRLGTKVGVLSKIFANPNMPEIDDYYEPFDFHYGHLQQSGRSQSIPTAYPVSRITGLRIERITAGPNWEDDLGGEFAKRGKDKNFDDMEREIYGQFEQSFLTYLPRLCEHCLNPACVATCPSGAIYKREEDGIVLIDQDKCRGWRLCISGCPYKKIYFNWQSGKSEKCLLCYPRIESGQPTLCAETCVGRIRYLGVMLYDADRIKTAASVENPQDLYEQQCQLFLDPHDPAVIQAAEEAGIAASVIDAAQKSPIYRLAIDWRLALPLHPEYRTLPMVWYVPPLSPIQSVMQSVERDPAQMVPDIDQLSMPIRYLANLLTAGDSKPVKLALKRLIAMRQYQRATLIENQKNTAVLAEVGLTVEQVEEMYRYLAIANYEDRYVVPTNHPELNNQAASLQGTVGFSFGGHQAHRQNRINLFNRHRIETKVHDADHKES